MIAIARRLMLLAIATFSLVTPAPTPPVSDAANEAVALSFFPEARLRKLHLVRPDLISYPVSFDVVC